MTELQELERKKQAIEMQIQGIEMETQELKRILQQIIKDKSKEECQKMLEELKLKFGEEPEMIALIQKIMEVYGLKR